MARPNDIVCYERGSNMPPWSGPIESIGIDFKALESYSGHNGPLQIEHEGDHLHISGMKKVGLLSLPSGRRIVIKSKIPNIVILEWLAFLGQFPDLESWHSDPSITRGDNFPECIGRFFIRELDTLTRRFIRKDFVPVRHSSSTLRGKVLTTQLCRAIHQLSKIPQLARIRTFDTQYNVVLALALDKVPMLMSDQGVMNCQKLARLRDEWTHISRETTDMVSAVTHAQWACPFGYRNALQLARLILLGAVVDSVNGAGGEFFTLSLAKVWEDGLRKIFDELQPITGWRLLSRGSSTCRWADATDVPDQTRWMTADILTERDRTRWILDAKYKHKNGFGNEFRGDRFQMCAYSLGFGAQRATLVYPTGSGTALKPRILLDVTVGKRNMIIDSIELPMAEGPETCRAAILSLCGIPSSRLVEDCMTYH